MASPCTNDPNEVISAVVGVQNAEENFESELDSIISMASENADKFNAFVNGNATQTVQLGEGSPTPTIRNTVRQMMSAAATLDSADVSGKSSTASVGEEMRTLATRFGDVVNVKDFGAKGDGVKTAAVKTTTVPKPAVLVVAGQSNALGQGALLEYNRSLIDSGSYYFHSGTNQWILGVADPMYPATRNGFVPRLTTNLRTAKGRPIYIVNVAVGNSSCNTSYVPDNGTWANTGSLRARALEVFNNAIQGMSLEYDVIGTVWLQGETDATGIKNGYTTIEEYTNCIKDTVAWFKTNVGGNFFIAKIAHLKGDSSYNNAFASVNSVLASLPSLISDCYIASSAAASFADSDMVDNFHYTESAYNSIGVELATFIKDYIQSDVYTEKTTPYDSYIGTDDTNAITAAVSACEEYGTLLFPKGNYIIHSSTNITKKGLRIKGEGAVVYQPEASTSAFLINADMCTVSDLTLVGALQGTGVYLKESSYSKVENCTIINFNRGVNVGTSLESQRVTFRSSIVNNVIRGSTGTAICQSNSRFAIISGNFVHDAGNEFITIDNGCYNTIVSDNVFTGDCYGCGGIGMDKGDYSVISNNQFYMEASNHNVPCITFNGNVGYCDGCVITGNFFHCFPRSGSIAIWMKGYSGTTAGQPHYYGGRKAIVSNNSIRGCSFSFRVEQNSRNNVFANNVFYDDYSNNYVNRGTNNSFYNFHPGIFLPSATKVNVSIPDNEETFTAPADGLIVFMFQSGSTSSGWVGIRNTTTNERSQMYMNSTLAKVFKVSAKKGEEIIFFWPGTIGSASYCYYISRTE